MLSDGQDQNEDEFTLNDNYSKSMHRKKKHEKKGRGRHFDDYDENAESAVFIDNLPKDENNLT